MDYYVIFATPGFLEGEQFIYSPNYPDSSEVPLATQILRVQEKVFRNSSQFERLENAECISTYANDMITDRRSVIVVSSDVPATNNSSLLQAVEVQTASFDLQSYPWICPLPSGAALESPLYGSYVYTQTCSRQVAERMIDPANWRPSNISAEFCLSERVAEQCGFYANIAIIWTVVVCNIAKLLIMGYIVFSQGLEKPLLTIGDSVASLITKPDPMTEDLGAITIYAVKAFDRRKRSTQTKGWCADSSPKWQSSSRLRWFHAVSIWRWSFTII